MLEANATKCNSGQKWNRVLNAANWISNVWYRAIFQSMAIISLLTLATAFSNHKLTSKALAAVYWN